MERTRYSVAEDLLVREIESLRDRISRAQIELHGLRTGQTSQVERGTTTGTLHDASMQPLSCAQAIDVVLSRAKKPISARDIEAGFGQYGLRVNGNPNIAAIRSALFRRADALGWKKSGRGKKIKWAKIQKEGP